MESITIGTRILTHDADLVASVMRDDELMSEFVRSAVQREVSYRLNRSVQLILRKPGRPRKQQSE